MNLKEAFFAGGCFWCMAKPYYDYEGIKKVYNGYMGGSSLNPTYDEVKKGNTGYLETVKIEYDEDIISFNQLLNIYFSSIDPFDEGGQYIDRGQNYTCALFYNNNIERDVIIKEIDKLEKSFTRKCYVNVKEVTKFYLAEEYHQDYHLKNPLLYHKEFSSSGRTIHSVFGKFEYNNQYYEIEVLNDKIINAKEINKFEIYDNPKSIKTVIQNIIDGLKKIKETLDYLNKEVTIKIDRKIGSIHPKHQKIIYPINYGYVPEIIGGDGEELDSYVLGEKEPLDTYCGKCIAVIHRLDEEDDKLVLTRNELLYNSDSIRRLTYFQEQYHTSIVIMAKPNEKFIIDQITKKEVEAYLLWKYDEEFKENNITDDMMIEAYAESMKDFEEKRYFAVKYNNEFIGIYSYYFQEGEMLIGLGLNPKYTCLGLGYEFIINCIEFGKKHYQYTNSVILRVLETNERAIHLYKKIGFKEYDRRLYVSFGIVNKFINMRKD